MRNECLRFEQLSDEQLLSEVTTLTVRERHTTAQLIAALAELDTRRLYLGAGYSSLFTYCTRFLHLSEHAAYGRIEVARAARRLPKILDLLADGSVTLTTVCLMAPHLTQENHEQLLAAVRHKTKRQVEEQVAALRPSPEVPPSVRKLPVTASSDAVPTFESQLKPEARLRSAEELASPASITIPPARPSIVAPVTPERYKVQFTISRETHDKLRRVQDLLRHSVPNGDPAVIFDRALTMLLQELEKKKLGRADTPRSNARTASTSRHVPAAVKRQVWARDGGQCAYVGTQGRCGERGFLEYHHVVPFASGGETTAANLQLRCRPHNAYEADRIFGPWIVREARDRFDCETRS